MSELVTYEHLVDLVRELRKQYPDAAEWSEFREVEKLLMLPGVAREPVRALLAKTGSVELRPPRPWGMCDLLERWVSERVER